LPDDRRILEGVARLVVDGTNVLHALGRASGRGRAGPAADGGIREAGAAPTPAAPSALVARLRAIVPAGVSVVVVLDGSPEHGLVARHVASGVEVRYAGRATADEAIIRMVEVELGGRATGTLVVSDDIELREAVGRAGGRTVRNGWLLARLQRQSFVTPTAGRPVRTSTAGATRTSRSGDERHRRPSTGPSDDSEDEAPRWSPGRGATRKRGNPKRRPSTGR